MNKVFGLNNIAHIELMLDDVKEIFLWLSILNQLIISIHVYDGYVYMKSLGYDEVAKICLTHSFNNHTIDEYIGKFDVTDEELTIIKTELAKTIYDEYDRLIQLCDCLAGA